MENYFGRFSTLWAIMSAKWRWDEKSYDKFSKICLSLTNYHIQIHPLRAEDGESYKRHTRKLLTIGEEISKKRKRQQSEYRARHRARMSRRFSTLDSSHSQSSE